MIEWLSKKTWKREVGVLLLVFLCVLAWFGMVPELRVLAYPFSMFAAGAFGLDAWSKQIHNNRPKGDFSKYEGYKRW